MYKWVLNMLKFMNSLLVVQRNISRCECTIVAIECTSNFTRIEKRNEENSSWFTEFKVRPKCFHVTKAHKFSSAQYTQSKHTSKAWLWMLEFKICFLLLNFHMFFFIFSSVSKLSVFIRINDLKHCWNFSIKI